MNEKEASACSTTSGGERGIMCSGHSARESSISMQRRAQITAKNLNNFHNAGKTDGASKSTYIDDINIEDDNDNYRAQQQRLRDEMIYNQYNKINKKIFFILNQNNLRIAVL